MAIKQLARASSSHIRPRAICRAWSPRPDSAKRPASSGGKVGHRYSRGLRYEAVGEMPA